MDLPSTSHDAKNKKPYTNTFSSLSKQASITSAQSITNISEATSFSTSEYWVDVQSNSISSLVADPRVKRGKIPKNLIPSVKKTSYSEISLKSFLPYLEQIKDELHSFENIQNSKNLPQFPNQPQSTLNPFDSPAPNIKINDIPSFFFEPNFDLQSPQTFAQVASYLSNNNNYSDLFNTSNITDYNSSAQDKLVTLLDNIELLLVNEISSRSNEFFSALEALQTLHSEKKSDQQSGFTHDSTSALNLVAEIEELLLKNSHILAPNTNNSSNIESKPEKTSESITTNTNTFSYITKRLKSALESVSEFGIQNLVVLHRSKLMEFINLNYHTWVINSPLLFQTYFKRNATDSIHNLQENTLNIGYFFGSNQFSIGFNQSILDGYYSSLKHGIVPLFSGMVRIGRCDQVLDIFSKEIITIAYEQLEESYPPEFQHTDKSIDFYQADVQQAFAESLRSISFDKYLKLLYDQFSKLLLISVHTLYMIDICHICIKNTQIIETFPFQNSVNNKLTYLIDQIIDIINVRFNKILVHRKDQLSKLNVSAFYSLFYLIRTFIYCMESIISRYELITKIKYQNRNNTGNINEPNLFEIPSNIKNSNLTNETSCATIRSFLSSFCKLFFENLHNERIKQLTITIESEQWIQSDIPFEFQLLMNNIIIVSSTISNNNQLNKDKNDKNTSDSNRIPNFSDIFYSKIAEKSACIIPIPFTLGFLRAGSNPSDNYVIKPKQNYKNNKNDINNSKEGSNKSENTAQQNFLILCDIHDSNAHENLDLATLSAINSQSNDANKIYPVVGSTLSLLKTMYEYIQVGLHFPNLIGLVLEDINVLLKNFNSKTCQVILGAGAVCSAGLKHISAKHIALVIRSLDLVLALLPAIKKIFSGIPPALPNKKYMATPNKKANGSSQTTGFATHVENSFLSVESDYKEHKAELINKLASIMSDRADIHVAKLASTKWDLVKSIKPKNPDSDDELGQGAFLSVEPEQVDGISLILKEIGKLHRILYKYLPISDVSAIFQKIIEIYNKKLLLTINHFNLKTAAGKLAVIYNFQYLSIGFSKLHGVPSLSNQLEIAANNINLVKDYLPATKPLQIMNFSQVKPELNSSKNQRVTNLNNQINTEFNLESSQMNRNYQRSINSESTIIDAKRINASAIRDVDSDSELLKKYNKQTINVGGLQVDVLVNKEKRNGTSNNRLDSAGHGGQSSSANSIGRDLLETPLIHKDFIDSPVSSIVNYDYAAISRNQVGMDNPEMDVFTGNDEYYNNFNENSAIENEPDEITNQRQNLVEEYGSPSSFSSDNNGEIYVYKEDNNKDKNEKQIDGSNSEYSEISPKFVSISTLKNQQ
ncbi:hypothetical protein BB558_007634 [Smittium angustum]|uniref:Vacuolar protein sorting-associated protein 54 C-terminal domain-containing protein n=1 Tax=Smittium angustum TaxID=133377 RepID=A0A2U1IUL3_SMIAN|nr:hypothetical protein BB558_007634 [Smittium angustum]